MKLKNFNELVKEYYNDKHQDLLYTNNPFLSIVNFYIRVSIPRDVLNRLTKEELNNLLWLHGFNVDDGESIERNIQFASDDIEFRQVQSKGK